VLYYGTQAVILHQAPGELGLCNDEPPEARAPGLRERTFAVTALAEELGAAAPVRNRR